MMNDDSAYGNYKETERFVGNKYLAVQYLCHPGRPRLLLLERRSSILTSELRAVETPKDNSSIRKSVIGSNIHIEVNQFRLTLARVFKQFTTFRLLI